jgi:hypothetical protein
MSQKRYQIAALQQRQFKVPVLVNLPADSVDSKGQMQYDPVHFVVKFRSLPADEVSENIRKIQELRDSPVDQIMAESVRQTKTYVLGIEKHPEHPFPFVSADGTTDAVMDDAAIEQLLNVREFRDAIEKAYGEARSGDLLTKNSRK